MSGRNHDGVLNLSIDGDCAQACSFCFYDRGRIAADDEPTWARLVAKVDEDRARGASHLRVHGFDPLAWPRIVELMEHATRVGFDRVDVFSPCTRLADPDFRDALLAALPARRRLYVPLYGTTAAGHDLVSGRPGSHALVLAALDGLLDRTPREDVTLTTVVVRDNVDELAALAAFAHTHAVPLIAHQPFPSIGGADRYEQVAVSQTDIAGGWAASVAGVGPDAVHLLDLATCVKLSAAAARGLKLPPKAGRDLHGKHHLEHKARYLEGIGAPPEAPIVPCPHVEACAVGRICTASFYRRYVELFGAKEFVPLAHGDLSGRWQRFVDGRRAG